MENLEIIEVDHFGNKIVGRVLFEGHSLVVAMESGGTLLCWLANSDMESYNTYVTNGFPEGKKWYDYVNHLLVGEDDFWFQSMNHLYTCIADGSAHLNKDWRKVRG